MELHPWISYIKEFAQGDQPYVDLTVIGAGPSRDAEGWIPCRLALGPADRPVLGTARVWVRTEDEDCVDPNCRHTSTRYYIVCEIETSATTPGHYLEIAPTSPCHSEIGIAVFCRLMPSIQDAVLESNGESPLSSTKVVLPLLLRARAVELAAPELPSASRCPAVKLPRRRVGQACWDGRGRYVWKADPNGF
ncbi:MAG: hypothetical protein P4L84_05910 [Isosphaeraceae bacterium]|nr:hypothetical protein [Isosphaeraceae bacterium]